MYNYVIIFKHFNAIIHHFKILISILFCSTSDVSAADNIGRVLAQRCRESGITSMILHDVDEAEKSEKVE